MNHNKYVLIRYKIGTEPHNCKYPQVPKGTTKLIAGICGIDFATPISVDDLCAQVHNFKVAGDENGTHTLQVKKPYGTSFTIRLDGDTDWLEPVAIVGGHPVHGPKIQDA